MSWDTFSTVLCLGATALNLCIALPFYAELRRLRRLNAMLVALCTDAYRFPPLRNMMRHVFARYLKQEDDRG
jgi:hypothetical protein